MSARAWTRDTGVRVALGAASIGAIAVVWALVNAFRAAPLPAAGSRTVAGLETLASTASHPALDAGAVIDNDVFSPDRTAPAVRYRMPNEQRASEQAELEPEKPTVLGTAVATDGRNFATVKLGEGNPTLVHVGDRIGEWTVRAIERGKITIVSASGARANIAVPKPGT